MYELKRTQQIDDSAHYLIQLVQKRSDFVRFNSGDVKCSRCGEPLEVYYCENATFAVRCMNCKTITLVRAKNPNEALCRVGNAEE